ERQPELAENLEALTKLLVEQQSGRPAWKRRIRVVCSRHTYSAIAAAGGPNMSFEDLLHRRAELKIRVALDPGAHQHVAELPARGHRGDAVRELDLAQRLHRLGPSGPVHRVRLGENRRTYVVATGQISQDLVEQVALGLQMQVMMRIDDRQVRLDNRFNALSIASHSCLALD